MNEDLLETIPAEHRDTARAALVTAFGTQRLAELRPVTRGSRRSLLYQMEIADRRYLLRLETGRDVFRDPRRGYACLRIAAEAGIAPPLRHADPAAGVLIMDWLAERPLDDIPGGRAGLVRVAGGLIARLQATPVFPPMIDYQAMLERMLGRVRDSGLFAPGLLDPHLEGFERLRRAYPWNLAAQVSSHNDLNPGNLLFDGERLWLIDWEFAFRNDPLVDLAIVADYFAPAGELEDALLSSWLGRAPDRGLRARLAVMRQLTRLYYGCLIASVSIGHHVQETDLDAPTMAEFEAGVADGRFAMGTPETLHLYGKTFLARFLAGFREPGFEEALVIAGHGHG